MPTDPGLYRLRWGSHLTLSPRRYLRRAVADLSVLRRWLCTDCCDRFFVHRCVRLPGQQGVRRQRLPAQDPGRCHPQVRDRADLVGGGGDIVRVKLTKCTPGRSGCTEPGVLPDACCCYLVLRHATSFKPKKTAGNLRHQNNRFKITAAPGTVPDTCGALAQWYGLLLVFVRLQVRFSACWFGHATAPP